MTDDLEYNLKMKGYVVLKSFEKQFVESFYIDDLSCEELNKIDIWLRKYKHDNDFNFSYNIGDEIVEFINNNIYKIENQEELDLCNKKLEEYRQNVQAQLCIRLKNYLNTLNNDNINNNNNYIPDVKIIEKILKNYDDFKSFFNYLNVNIPDKKLIQTTKLKLKQLSNKAGLSIKEDIEEICCSKNVYKPFVFFMPRVKKIFYTNSYSNACEHVDLETCIELNNGRTTMSIGAEYNGWRDGDGSVVVYINSTGYKSCSDGYIDAIKEIMNEYGFKHLTKNMVYVIYFNRLILKMVSNTWDINASRYYITYDGLLYDFDINESLSDKNSDNFLINDDENYDEYYHDIQPNNNELDDDDDNDDNDDDNDDNDDDNDDNDDDDNDDDDNDDNDDDDNDDNDDDNDDDEDDDDQY